MSKHTVFVEAPPFAKFSDAEMRRLLDDERLEVLDWRGKRVNTPGFVEALATADIAVTGNSLTITDELLEKLPNLKLIAKLGTGLDMIDIPSVLRRGILLCNTPGANSVAVAEHTFALLLGYLRNVPQCDNAVRTGQWEKARTMGGEICGKTVGIIGLGNIGSRVASRMAGFEARLLGTDPCWPEALAAKYGIERRELNELLAESDIVCADRPLDETTAGFIGKAELALMKPSALLVRHGPRRHRGRGRPVRSPARQGHLRRDHRRLFAGAAHRFPAVLAGQRDPVPARRGLHYGCAQRHVPHVR